MTSTMPVKESAAMPVQPARAAPPYQSDDRIAPYQLWQHLSSRQQQHVRQVLLHVAQQLVAHVPNPVQCKETTHAPQSHPEPSATHPATSCTQSGYLHSPIEPEAGA